MDQPLNLHSAAIINLCEQFATTTKRMAAHRPDYTRAEQLAQHIQQATGNPAFAVPPTLPLNSYAPTIAVTDIGAAIPAIEQTGHIVINNAGIYQINPHRLADDNALTFKLEQIP